MKTLRKLPAILAFVLASLTFSCQPDPVNTIGDKLGGDKASVNSWIYDMMNEAYFLYDQMPKKSQVDGGLSPDKYFAELVYQPQTYDRFSTLTDDIDALQAQFNGVVKAFGINYVPAYIDNGQNNIALFISHVNEGSPADDEGLKRGDIIARIDGQQLTKNNYLELMSTKETVSLNLAAVENNTLVTGNNTVSITKAALEANPVAYSKVISKQGKKIGYLVYTQFVPGSAAQEKKYDDQLRQVFGEFKSAGVNELVLDLRLNGGGYMTSAVTLGSLILPGLSGKKLFYKEQWNDKYIQYWKKEKGEDALNYYFSQEANNIGSRLDRVFVLTSQGTASASELIINGLAPYMDVVTIGDHTAGKNLFGALIGDEQKRWKYGIYMMLGQTTNAEGKSDYGTVNGIAPTKQVADTKFPFLPFGDENETLLNAALQHIGVAAGVNARTAQAREAIGLGGGPQKDTPGALDGRMVREMPK